MLTGEDTLTTYTFNTGTAKHHFCSSCGIKSFYVPRSKPDGYSVNARCLDDGAVRVTPHHPVRRPALGRADGRARPRAERLIHADTDPHARAVAHHGGGQARQMACEGGR